ncbi:hypothetical protein FOZ62_021004, partial [Perkinsus olseni]
ALLGAMMEPRYKLAGVERLGIVREFRKKDDLLDRENLVGELKVWTINENVHECVAADEGEDEATVALDDSRISPGTLPKWESRPRNRFAEVERSVEAEVQRYIKMECHGDSFDEWWKKAEREGFKYLPTAARASRHILLSTSSCETLFSKCKNELGILRASMGTQALEATMI